MGSMYGISTYCHTWVHGVYGASMRPGRTEQLEVDRTKIEEKRGPVDQLTRRHGDSLENHGFLNRRYVFKWFEFSIVIRSFFGGVYN